MAGSDTGGWSPRWNRLLESFGWGASLARGRTWARAGHVLDYLVAPGLVTARVRSPGSKPYQVIIRIKTLSGPEWDRVIETLASRPVLASRLLAGEMPREIEDAFTGASVSLFPGRDIETSCPCADWANPCKHAAAVLHILGRRFDADPFLLFQLRGLERQELHAALRRGHPPTGGPVTAGQSAADESQERPDLAAPEQNNPPADPALFWSAGPGLSRVELHCVPPRVQAAVLQRLGPLPGSWDRVDPREWLAECYRTVSERALADLDEP